MVSINNANDIVKMTFPPDISNILETFIDEKLARLKAQQMDGFEAELRSNMKRRMKDQSKAMDTFVGVYEEKIKGALVQNAKLKEALKLANLTIAARDSEIAALKGRSMTPTCVPQE